MICLMVNTEKIKMQKINTSSEEYLELATKTCNILQIQIKDEKKLESILHKMEKWTQGMLYCSLTQKEIIELTTEIYEEIKRKDNINAIDEKITKLEDMIFFDRYFD